MKGFDILAIIALTSSIAMAKSKYRISSYSFRGNYSFLNLDIQKSQYLKVRKLFKGGNYSRAETIWGNTEKENENWQDIHWFWVLTKSGEAFILLKFIYSEKATKFCKIYTLLLSYVVPVKSKVNIPQNCVAFSEHMNFI